MPAQRLRILDINHSSPIITIFVPNRPDTANSYQCQGASLDCVHVLCPQLLLPRLADRQAQSQDRSSAGYYRSSGGYITRGGG